MVKLRNLLESVISALIIVTMVFVAWEAYIAIFDVPESTLPHLSSIASGVINRAPLFLRNTWVTLKEAALGFFLSVSIGIGLAVVMAYSKPIRRAVYPVLVGFRSVPKIPLAPVFIVWFGLGILSKIMMAFFISFFPIVVMTLSGLTDIPRSLEELSRSLNMSNWQMFTKVRFPHAIPKIFDGIKIGWPLALIGASIGEFVGANRGLGNLAIIEMDIVATDLMFGVFVYIAIFAVAIFGFILFLDKKIAWWRSA